MLLIDLTGLTFVSLIQVMDTRGRILTALGSGLWPSLVLFSEIVQTFILADFCYYYVKRCAICDICLHSPKIHAYFMFPD